MADIYLGRSGSEVKLPKIRSFGSLPYIPIPQTLQYDEAQMSDGSYCYNVMGVNPKTWSFVFENLTAAELAPLQALNILGEVLRFQNNWESADWTWAFIIGFEPEIDLAISTDADVRWRLALKLREVPD